MSADQPNRPNLDLIQMVQRARMQHDADARPSQATGVYWIEARPRTPQPPQPTARAGEWVIATTLEAVDAAWARVKAATEAGQLGYKSKVSTAPGPGQADPNARLIVVRTVDADDAADMARVRDALVALGLPPDPYRPDRGEG